MADSQQQKLDEYQDQVQRVLGKSAAVTAFILINGIVIAGIAFLFLHLITNNVKAEDAANLTRDVVHSTQQSIRDMEKTVNNLGSFYAADNDGTDDAKLTSRVQRLLTGNTPFDALLWVTDKGVWHQEDMLGQTQFPAYSAANGWPSYQDVFRQVIDVDYNQIGYEKLPWPAFASKTADLSQMPVGLLLKLRMPGAGTGILLVVTTPERIFGNAWTTHKEEISSVTIQDRDSGDTVVSTKTEAPVSGGFAVFGNETYDDVLQLGNKYWTMHFEVRPSFLSKLLSATPWAVLVLILLLTGIAALIAERKRRQDIRLAEMSKDLEGAHSELISKTSERDKLFHALRKSERENRAVINSVSDVIFETDETGKLVFLNDTWKRITHRELSDALGQSLFTMLEGADQAKQKEMFDELVRGERQAYRAETRLSLGHGAMKPIEIAFSMLRMAEDKSIRVVGTITDIEKRRRAEMAVREAEQRFRTIFENSISGIYQTSPDGKFISGNPALAEILGYSSPEDLMLSVSDIGNQVYVNAEDRKEFVQKLLFEGRVSGMETEVYRKDGRKIWVLENARVVRSDKGGVAYYEGSIWDVTERKEAEETMRQARFQAEISSRARLEFLANMSHEVRTPLNAIIGFSEIIKDEVMGPIGTPIYKEYARDVFDSGNYLLKIIGEILEVSKIETGKRELNLSNVKMKKVMKSCETIMSTRIEQSGVSVKMQFPDDLPELLVEELAFKQIMLNLVGNAVKFTNKDGNVTVSAYTDESTGGMIIDVVDTGIGMNEAEIKKAMTPFGKVDTTFSGMKEGTGLGLTIVDALVRLHNGQFKLISEKGVGTTARIVLPPFRVLTNEGTTAAPMPPQLRVVK